jgi:DNA topoisomerase-1
VLRRPDGGALNLKFGSAVPSDARTTRLVIVESPSKARTIAGYLGPDYFVEASFGHVRDLPRRAADVPAKYKGEAWARLGVDVDNGFQALYVVSQDRKQQIAKLQKLAKEVDEIFLATDEDREGEAIAWHLVETIRPKVPVKRMVFHEITKPAIQAAVANPREIGSGWRSAQRNIGTFSPRSLSRVRSRARAASRRR